MHEITIERAPYPKLVNGLIDLPRGIQNEVTHIDAHNLPEALSGLSAGDLATDPLARDWNVQLSHQVNQNAGRDKQSEPHCPVR